MSVLLDTSEEPKQIYIKSHVHKILRQKTVTGYYFDKFEKW